MGPALRTCFMGRQPFTGYCTTCRRRRVKCDRTEPVCNRCVKAGLECPGYKQVMRMQQHFVGRGGGLIRAPGGSVPSNGPKYPGHSALPASRDKLRFHFTFATIAGRISGRVFCRLARLGTLTCLTKRAWLSPQVTLARPKRILTWNPKLPSFLRLLSRLSSLRWIED